MHEHKVAEDSTGTEALFLVTGRLVIVARHYKQDREETSKVDAPGADHDTETCEGRVCDYHYMKLLS